MNMTMRPAAWTIFPVCNPWSCTLSSIFHIMLLAAWCNEVALAIGWCLPKASPSKWFWPLPSKLPPRRCLESVFTDTFYWPSLSAIPFEITILVLFRDSRRAGFWSQLTALWIINSQNPKIAIKRGRTGLISEFYDTTVGLKTILSVGANILLVSERSLHLSCRFRCQ